MGAAGFGRSVGGRCLELRVTRSAEQSEPRLEEVWGDLSLKKLKGDIMKT